MIPSLSLISLFAATLYESEGEVRKDIQKFWDQTRFELDKVSMAPFLEEVPLDGLLFEFRVKSVINYRVALTSFEGRRIRAWFTLPAGQPPTGGWPAVMVLPGYPGVLALPLHLVHSGYATLSLYPRGQGESVREWEVEHDTRLTYHITDKDKYYYRGAYMDCVRGLDFLSQREEVDAHRIGVWGGSQGGGLTLATASLDKRPRVAVSIVPWLCNFPVAAGITTVPYKELHDYLEEHPDQREQVMATLEFFDTLNLANDITCPTIVSTAIKDEVHPYRTVMPVFERIPALKSAVVYPDLEHGAGSDFAGHALEWLGRYLR